MSADLTESLLLYIYADQNEQALSPSCTVLGVLNQEAHLERSSGHVVFNYSYILLLCFSSRGIQAGFSILSGNLP